MYFLKILLVGSLVSAAGFAGSVSARNLEYRPDGDERGRTETLHLNMNNAVYQGQNRTFDLSGELARLYRQIDFSRAQLESVRVFAKSRHGRGSIELKINQNPQDRQTAPEGRFEDNSYNSFYAIDLSSYQDRRGGNWRLIMDGNIKINRIEARVKTSGSGGWPPTPPNHPNPPTYPPRPPQPPPPSISYQWAGSGVVDQFSFLTSTFIVNQWNISRLNIAADRNDLHVHQAVIEYSNGQQQLLPGLTGYIPFGSNREVQLSRTDIARVHITATSPSLVGPRGQFQLYLGFWR